MFHLSELNREAWGRGHLGSQTRDIFDILELGGYEGPVDLENFAPDLYGIVGIAQTEPEDPHAVLKEGAAYVQKALSL